MIIFVPIDRFVVFLLHFSHSPFYLTYLCTYFLSIGSIPLLFPFPVPNSFLIAIAVMVSGLSRSTSPVGEGTGEKPVFIAFDQSAYCREPDSC